MRWWVAAIVAVLGVGLCAAFIDGDPRGIATGAFTAKSAGLTGYDGKELTPEQQGAVYFAFGPFVSRANGRTPTGPLSSSALGNSHKRMTL